MTNSAVATNLAPGSTPTGAATIGPPLALSFSPPAAIQAGQSLAFSWQLMRLTRIQDSVGTSVVATLTANGTELWSSTVPVSSVVIGGDVIYENTGLLQENIDQTALSPQAAAVLYIAGTKTLQLAVAGNGPHHDPFTAQASLAVSAGSFFGVWWSWNPGPTAVDWKTPYSLSGVFSNFSTAPLSVLRATLIEDNITQNSVTPLQTLNLGPVGLGINVSVAFPLITQTWQWLDDVTFLLTAPTTENFGYTMQLQGQDPWDNQYQATSQTFSVTVSVSESKRNDDTAAQGAAANAAGLATAAAFLAFLQPEIAAGLFAAAAAAYATAQAFATSAKDPPQPDPNYRVPVEKEVVQIPSQLSGSPLLDALADFYRQIFEITSAHEALSTVRGRMLGALRANARDALDQHVIRYGELIINMQQAALSLAIATARAVQVAQTDPSLEPQKIATDLAQLKRSGIPEQAKAAWAAIDLTQQSLLAIESIIKRSPIEMLTTPIPQQLTYISLRASSWAASAASTEGFGLRG